jgi:hypothetical protein
MGAASFTYGLPRFQLFHGCVLIRGVVVGVEDGIPARPHRVEVHEAPEGCLFLRPRVPTWSGCAAFRRAK